MHTYMLMHIRMYTYILYTSKYHVAIDVMMNSIINETFYVFLIYNEKKHI